MNINPNFNRAQFGSCQNKKTPGFGNGKEVLEGLVDAVAKTIPNELPLPKDPSPEVVINFLAQNPFRLPDGHPLLEKATKDYLANSGLGKSIAMLRGLKEQGAQRMLESGKQIVKGLLESTGTILKDRIITSRVLHPEIPQKQFLEREKGDLGQIASYSSIYGA